MADERGTSLGAVLLAFLSGAAVGAVAMLLLSPQAGAESREQVRRYTKRTEGNLRDLAGKAGETLDKAVGKGREFVAENKTVLTEAYQAGREAMRRERERLSAMKKE
ncbi:MAG: YtxH domain-containing protein [Candidatus Methylomirabilaceae bacterium]